MSFLLRRYACLSLGLALSFGVLASGFEAANAWSLPVKLPKKSSEAIKKSESKKPEPKKSDSKDQKAKAESAKKEADKAKANKDKANKNKDDSDKPAKPEQVKAIKPSKISNPKPAEAKLSTPDDKLVKSEVASVEGFAAMAIENGAASNAAKQSIARQYYFRNAFAARPDNALPADQVETVASFIQSYNKKVPSAEVRTYAEAIVYFCQFYQVNPKLVTGMIAIESSFRTDAVSSSGAIGLGQLKPDTANWLSVSDPYDPIENIGGMTRYISWLIRKYNGSYDHAVSAYYQGPGTVDRNGITEACLPYLYKVNGALAKF